MNFKANSTPQNRLVRSGLHPHIYCKLTPVVCDKEEEIGSKRKSQRQPIQNTEMENPKHPKVRKLKIVILITLKV